MEERDILLQTIESLNASIQTLSADHKKEVESLNTRIKELTAQVAWLNRQLFGRKSEKLGIIDPAQLNLFADIQSEQMQEAITYAYTRWDNMMRYLEDGMLLLDNNLAENEIRPITLGRTTSSAETMRRPKTWPSYAR